MSKRSADGGAAPAKKKAKAKKTPSGVPVFCGSSHWSATIDAKVESKVLVTPHKFATMAGRQISKVVMGPTSISGFLISKQGSVFAFGRNDDGQLGLGDEKSRSFPRKIEVSASRILDVAAGKKHTLMLGADGEVYAMGKNECGQLGLGKKVEKQLTPTQITAFPGGFRAVKVACGADFSMVLSDKGVLYAFGHPDKGCLGNGTTGEYFITASKLTYHFEYTPIEVRGYREKSDDDADVSAAREKTEWTLCSNVTITDMACGAQHSVALDSRGNVYTWGFGGFGRLGHSSATDEMFPRRLIHFKPENPFTGGGSRLFAGEFSNFVESKAQGRLFFWGQLKSSGEATMYPKPHDQVAEVSLNCMSVGRKHVALVINSPNETYTMGSSPCYGELGYGEGIGKSSTTFNPVNSLVGCQVIDVACGFAQTLFVVDDSTVEARRALSKLPTIGTLPIQHVLQELATDATDAASVGDQVTALVNVREMTAAVENSSQSDRKKIKDLLPKLTEAAKAVFASLSDSFEGGGFKLKAGEDDEQELQDSATEYVNELVELAGTDVTTLAGHVGQQLADMLA